MSKPVNPLAFPGGPQANPGMTLRDWFAGQVIVGMMANDGLLGDIIGLAESKGAARVLVASKLAYEMADAMLAEREKGE